MKTLSTRKPRPDWNQRGPYVPPWFRSRLTKMNPNWVLQYTPVRSRSDPRGVDGRMYPHGVWDICFRLPRSGMLHSCAVWSLTDEYGHYSPPGHDTLRLLKKAIHAHRWGHMGRLAKELDLSLRTLKRARARNSREALQSAITHYLTRCGKKQFQNRISMYRSEE